MFTKLNRKSAQGTLEYVLMLTAIIAVVIVIAGGFLRTRVQSGLDHATDEMEKQVQKIKF